MKYLVAYAVYAIGITGFLVQVVPPRPPLEALAPRHDDGEVQMTLSVMDTDDYFMQPCTVKVSALAVDAVLFSNRDEFQRAREALGC